MLPPNFQRKVGSTPTPLFFLGLILVVLVFAPMARAQDAGVVDGGGAAGDAPGTPRVVSPRLLERARPAYPADGGGRRVDVELLLTLNELGAVTHTEVLGHIPADAPESFDHAARAACASLRFEPARREGVPIPVRLRFHLAIAPPVVAHADAEVPELHDDEPGAGAEGLTHAHDQAHPPVNAGAADAGAADAGAATDATAAPEAGVPAPEGPAAEAVVRGGTRDRTASHYDLELGALRNVPRLTGAEVLSLAPGVMLSNEGTEGHAQHVFLRGFTGENGQDIAFSVDGIPLNEESNIHGQGYVDLYFLVPELVSRLDVTEGTADPRQGNFAVAGSIDYHLALPTRGLTVRSTLGRFNYQRLVALYGPGGHPDETFAAVDLVHSDGFGPSRGFDRASAVAQWVTEAGRSGLLRLLATVYATRFVSPGVVREDDLDAGRVDFFGAYPEAGRQGGLSSRALVAAAYDWRRAGERAELRVFGQARDLSLTENFTGYLLRAHEGDLIEQRYGGGTVGANGYYQRTAELFHRTHAVELGWFTRHDRYALAQRRLQALTSEPSRLRDNGDVSADVRATHVGLYLDLTARLLPRLTLRGGARLDALAYDVSADVFRAVDQRTERVNRNALGVHVGPKATAELHLGRGVTLLGSLGSGFRSPDALTLADGESAPFVSVLGQELGARWTLGNEPLARARLAVSTAAYHTLVGNDLLFDPTVGRSVPIGASRRLGAVLWLRARPRPWLDVNASLTYTRATVENDALGSTVPAGSLLPYVPAVVARLDVGLERDLGRWRSWAVRARGGLGASFYGPRPLPLDERSEPVFLVDLSAALRVGALELGASAKNLLDARWRDAQLNTASNFNPGTASSFFPVRHFTAGSPLTFFLTLGVYL
ncbi:MAG: TonB-dependent receptor [Deltaproteobacteria bacterium]|nr:TonB-dependent receptor [Deltaproteobacteria bacterium]